MSTLLGRGWCLDLLEDGTFLARRPQEPQEFTTLETFYTTVWYREPRRDTV